MYSACEGLKVVDFTQMIAGPYCSMVLGDMGADVVKIEHPDRGDLIRRTRPYVNGESYPYLLLNRNKRSLAIDIARPQARDVLYRLTDACDVMMVSLRPGTLEKFGLGYEAVRERNPRIIYCCVSGFGATGPYKDLGGYDLIAQAFSGMMSVTGDPDGVPVRTGYPVLDMLAGSFALSSVLAALRERERTGRGQLLDVSLAESGLACSFWQTAVYFAAGNVVRSHGTGHPTMSPYQVFRASNGYFVLAINSDEHWARACKILDLEAIRADPRFDSGPNRYKNQGVLIPMMEERLTREPVEHWLAQLIKVGIPCSRVNTIDQALEDPHVRERGMVMTAEHPTAGTFRTLAPPMMSSEDRAEVRRPPPTLGEQNAELLGGLGFSDEDVRALERAGVVPGRGRP